MYMPTPKRSNTARLVGVTQSPKLSQFCVNYNPEYTKTQGIPSMTPMQPPFAALNFDPFIYSTRLNIMGLARKLSAVGISFTRRAEFVPWLHISK